MSLFSGRFIANYKMKRHKFKSVGKYMAFCDYHTLEEIEKETKWYKIVQEHVDIIFDVLHKCFKHKFKVLERKSYAEVLYKNIFDLNICPSDMLIEFVRGDHIGGAFFPQCPLIEINLSRLNEGIYSNTMYHALFGSILYMRIVEKLWSDLSNGDNCDKYGEYELIPIEQFIAKLPEEKVEIIYMGTKTSVDLKALYTKYIRWTANINLKLDKLLNERVRPFELSVIEHNDSINLILKRKT